MKRTDLSYCAMPGFAATMIIILEQAAIVVRLGKAPKPLENEKRMINPGLDFRLAPVGDLVGVAQGAVPVPWLIGHGINGDDTRHLDYCQTRSGINGIAKFILNSVKMTICKCYLHAVLFLQFQLLIQCFLRSRI